MSRGISSFTAYYTKVFGGQTTYFCAHCDARICSRHRGNALATSAKAKAAVRAHVAASHPDKVKVPRPPAEKQRIQAAMFVQLVDGVEPLLKAYEHESVATYVQAFIDRARKDGVL